MEVKNRPQPLGQHEYNKVGKTVSLMLKVCRYIFGVGQLHDALPIFLVVDLGKLTMESYLEKLYFNYTVFEYFQTDIWLDGSHHFSTKCITIWNCVLIFLNI